MSREHFRIVPILLLLFSPFLVQGVFAVAGTDPRPEADAHLTRPQEVSPQAWDQVMETIQQDHVAGDTSPQRQPDPYQRELKLLADDTDDYDYFGNSIAVSDDTLVVGTFYKNAAYVFSRNQDGADKWGQVKKLTASDAAPNDRFGESVAISNDTIVVGAFADDDDGDASGSAYVFERNEGSADNWGEVEKLTASDGASEDRFGDSVAIYDDTIVIGAFGDDDNGSESGSAYVFERNEGGADNWGEVEKLTASDGAADDQFGRSVAISGDTIVVGAAEQGSRGRAYVYARNQGGADEWDEVKRLGIGYTSDGDYFGRSLAISGDTIVVGAPENDTDAVDSGAVLIYTRNQGGADNWGATQVIKAPDAANQNYFGNSVSISGDTIVVGSNWGDGTARRTGAAYVLGRNRDGADQWGVVKKLFASDGMAWDNYGGSVAVSGDTIAVASLYDSENGTAAGAAYLYPAQDLEFHEIHKLTDAYGAEDDKFGRSVSISGDTLVIGQPGDESSAGAAFIYSRNSDGSAGIAADTWGFVQTITASIPTAGDEFGGSVAISADTIVVGAEMASSERGAAYVYTRNQGGADNWGHVRTLTASDGVSGDRFGRSVAISGDTIVVGAWGDDDAGSYSGSVYVFECNESGADNWGQVEKLTATGGESLDYFGYAVAISGDTIIVGAHGDDDEKGAAYIFSRNQGGADNWGQVDKLTSLIRASGADLGRSVSISGDTAVAGATGESAHRGSAYVFERNEFGADDWGQVEKLTPSEGKGDDWFGFSVAISGDMIVVGSHYHNTDDWNDAGSAYVYTRNQDGADEWGLAQYLKASDLYAWDRFGQSVAIDDDTIAVGAPDNDDYGDESGSAYVFTTFQPQKVWFDEAHNSWNTIDWERALVISDTFGWPEPEWIYFGELTTALAPAYELISQTVPLSGDALQSYDAVILPPREDALSQAEIEALNWFIADGGGLIMIGDCGFWDPNPTFSASFGITFDPDCVYAPVPNATGDILISNPNYNYWAPVAGIHNFEMNWGQTLILSGDAVWLADTTHKDAWVDRDPWDGIYNSGEEGEFDVAAAYDDGCGRVAVVADNAFQDDGFEGRRNDRLMRALLTWVTDGQSCIQHTYVPLVVR
jgi:hypothetical protein